MTRYLVTGCPPQGQWGVAPWNDVANWYSTNIGDVLDLTLSAADETMLIAGGVLEPAGWITHYLAPGSGDDSAAFAAAVAAGGLVVLSPGRFDFSINKVSGIPSPAVVTKNTPVRIVGSGRGKTICKFGGGIQQLIGFNKTADYDSFTGIEISDLTVDASNIATLHNTGAILGTGVSGTSMSRINIDDVHIERVDAINVPYNTGLNCGVFLSVAHTAVGETQTNVTNIRIDDVRVFGGAGGFMIQGNGVASSGPGTPGTNIFFDHIHVSNWYHDSGNVPDGSVSFGANVIVGNNGFGGSDIVVENGYGKGSPDVGVEIDAVQSAVIRNVLIEDNWNGAFYQTNYRDPQNPNSQRIIFENCRVKRVNAANPFPSFAIQNHASTTPLGTVVWKHCSYYSNKAAPLGAIGEAFGTQSAGVLMLGELVIDGFEVVMEGMSDAGAGSTDATAGLIALATAPTVRPTVIVNDLKVGIYGAMTGGGSNFPIGLRTEGAMHLKIDGLDFDETWTTPNGGAKVLDIGRTTSNISGAIKRIRVRRIHASPVPIGVVVRSTGTLTIPTMISVEDYDGAALTTNSAMFSIDTTQAAKVMVSRLRGPTYPKPSAAMDTSNFIAGTFTTATGNQYRGPEPAEIHFAAATGSGITLIDVSKDGSTYENAYTQASGAMAQTVLVPVDPGDFVKVTFATTQPTTKIRFRRG